MFANQTLASSPDPIRLQLYILCYTVASPMTTRKLAAFRLDPEIIDGLQRIKERDGVPVSEQVRRALLAWLQSRGAIKLERKKASTRKRPSA